MRRFFYHPITKCICLLLCIASVISFGYCGAKLVFMESIGVLYENAEMAWSSQGNSMYWPEEWEWTAEKGFHYFGEDPLYYRIWDILTMNDMLEYKESPRRAEDENIWGDDAWEGAADSSLISDTVTEETPEVMIDSAGVTEETPEVMIDSAGVTEETERSAYDMLEIESWDEAAVSTEDPDSDEEFAEEGWEWIDSATFALECNGDMIRPENLTQGMRDFLQIHDGVNSNFMFRFSVQDGQTFLSNMGDASRGVSGLQDYHALIFVPTTLGTDVKIVFEYGLKAGLPIDDAYRMYADRWTADAASRQDWIIGTMAFAGIFLLLFVTVLVQSGGTVNETELPLRTVDRIPLEIVAVTHGTVFVLLSLLVRAMFELFDIPYYHFDGLVLGQLFGYVEERLAITVFSVILAVLLLLLFLDALIFLCTVIRRIRRQGWWKSTLIYCICSFLFRILKKSAALIAVLFWNLSIFWRWILGCSVFFVWTVLAFLSREIVLIFIWTLTVLTVCVLGCLYLLMLDRVRKGAKCIASGSEVPVYMSTNMIGAPRDIASSLNHIEEAIRLAVEERLKSERFRTELITNVSHDLKTPLTVILNYTDLLSQIEIEDETARSYIQVLQKQSTRLKKLTEDLLEVSKASSGTLPVSLMETDAGELLVQAIGEYTERFAARDLMPILNVPELPLLISADGKCLWRVFDNLLSNICKYSMPGTRIYFSAQTDGKTALIVFRNISEQAISLDADELKERFVRGDTSRHSEGSGLGLAIADSLVSLQNGRMQVTVDGDLFKVSLTFPLFQ